MNKFALDAFEAHALCLVPAGTDIRLCAKKTFMLWHCVRRYVSIKRIVDSVSAGSSVSMEPLCATVEVPDLTSQPPGSMLTTLSSSLGL